MFSVRLPLIWNARQKDSPPHKAAGIQRQYDYKGGGVSYVNRNQRGTGKENKRPGKDVAGNMAKLWQQNKNFVYSIARKYGESEIDDLMQEGISGNVQSRR